MTDAMDEIIKNIIFCNLQYKSCCIEKEKNKKLLYNYEPSLVEKKS